MVCRISIACPVPGFDLSPLLPSTVPYDPTAPHRTHRNVNHWAADRLLDGERIQLLIWNVIPKEAAHLSSDISAKSEGFQLNKNEK